MLAGRTSQTSYSVVPVAAHNMDNAAWNSWFESNFPTKVGADARVKYSSLLVEHEVFDVETLAELLELEPDFLATKICVKNVALQSAITSFVSSSGSSDLSPHPAKSAYNSTDFEPVTNIGSEVSRMLWKIDNVRKIHHLSQNRSIYCGSFTVANVTQDVIIKRQAEANGNDLKHESLVYKAIGITPCLAQLYHFHEQEPDSYLVLERFGQSLCTFMHNKCAIRLQILEELGLALGVLHGAGYVHCDLKPQNILVDSREGCVRLKLCDLDSAERIGDLHQHLQGAMKYTEQWVCPEVYFGRGGELRVAPAMDVFAFGLIAAVLLDDAVSEQKTILPRRSDDVTLYEMCLSNQAVLTARMPCQRSKRHEALVHRMCAIDPATRATLKDVDLALNTSRATAIHAQVSALSRENEFLKSEVITHLKDIKQSLADLGAKMTQLLQNDVELRNMVGTVLDGNFDCPTLFVYVPVAATKSVWSRIVDPLSFVQDRFRLFFLCAQTMELVPCGPQGDGFPVACNKQWLVTAAPYIRIGLLLLKEVLAVYHVPLPIAQTLNLLANDVNLHARYIDGALNFVSACCRAGGVDKALERCEPVSASLGAVSREAELRTLDRSPSASKEAYASLKAVLTAHGHWDNISTTCGLALVRYRGYQAWIKADKTVEAQFHAACEAKLLQQTHRSPETAGTLAEATSMLSSVVTPASVAEEAVALVEAQPLPPFVTADGVSLASLSNAVGNPIRCRQCGDATAQLEPLAKKYTLSCTSRQHAGNRTLDHRFTIFGCNNACAAAHVVCGQCVETSSALLNGARRQIAEGVPVTCPNHHIMMVVPDCEAAAANSCSFLCDLCLLNKSKRELRFKCVACDVDYCLTCVPIPYPPGIKEIDESGVQGFNLFDDQGSYAGEAMLVDGKMVRHGKGLNCYPDGAKKYQGDWVKNKRHGIGSTVNTDASGVTMYTGSYQNDVPHGPGIVVTSFRETYEGDFENGGFHGKGRLKNLNGGEYEGDWVNHKKHGQGRCKYPDGEMYEGDWVDDKRCGKGTCKYAHGTVYEGDWVDDKWHGQGRYEYPDGEVYEGDWKEGERHGRGFMTDIHGRVFGKGRYVNGRKTIF